MKNLLANIGSLTIGLIVGFLICFFFFRKEVPVRSPKIAEFLEIKPDSSFQIPEKKEEIKEGLPDNLLDHANRHYTYKDTTDSLGNKFHIGVITDEHLESPLFNFSAEYQPLYVDRIEYLTFKPKYEIFGGLKARFDDKARVLPYVGLGYYFISTKHFSLKSSHTFEFIQGIKKMNYETRIEAVICF